MGGWGRGRRHTARPWARWASSRLLVRAKHWNAKQKAATGGLGGAPSGYTLHGGGGVGGSARQTGVALPG